MSVSALWKMIGRTGFFANTLCISLMTSGMSTPSALRHPPRAVSHCPISQQPWAGALYACQAAATLKPASLSARMFAPRMPSRWSLKISRHVMSES